MTQESLKSKDQHKNINTVRQRRKDKSSKQQRANSVGHEEKEQAFNLLYEEPALGAPGTVTVAFRCPNGETRKRRFNIELFVQSLVDYAELLGYSPTSYCIMTTYPRKPLSDTTKRLTDAGLTHDVVLVIDDLDE